MPSAKTLQTPAQVVCRHWRAGCKESLHAQFGGGPTEKARTSETSPAAYPTSRSRPLPLVLIRLAEMRHQAQQARRARWREQATDVSRE